MTFNKSEDIMNNIFLSLKVPKGSRLHLLRRAKLTDRTVTLAEEYCREALQWLLDIGRATKIDIFSERDSKNIHRLNLKVEVIQADGREISFQTFVEVE